MIKIENTETYGWETAIRGMRNPYESWGKSDSCYCSECLCDCCRYDIENEQNNCASDYSIGPNDHALMMKLVSAGPDHSKFMRMITVTADVTAPLYWWKEADTYKVGTVANSCSTMHKIHDKEFALDDFSHEHLGESAVLCLLKTIKLMNAYRKCFVDYDKPHDPPHKLPKKEYWWQLIQILPSSYNQRRTIQLNYAVLRNIYHARKDHKLDEWRDFCKWIEGLPYSELITG